MNPMETSVYLYALTLLSKHLEQPLNIEFSAQEMIHTMTTPPDKQGDDFIEVSMYGLPNGRIRIVVGPLAYQAEQREALNALINPTVGGPENIPMNSPDVVGDETAPVSALFGQEIPQEAPEPLTDTTEAELVDADPDEKQDN